ncbi:MarR family transcriptional regulator [Nocardia sp. NPDC050435]|uniref:MarR family winged helix-turn-helix transcriptional regulator n=1 Tax=Nocardia sp. NPDC050435 TaxID=3155040 RepID=UPI00340330D5
MDDVQAVERLTLALENFNSVFIRLPDSGRLSFSALSVLHTLSRVGSCRLSDLVRTEQIKQPALTSAVAKLADDGLMRREPDPLDGRAAVLSLTDAGQALVRERHTDRARRLGVLLERLSPEDRVQLLGVAEIFDRIVHLADEPGEGPQL